MFDVSWGELVVVSAVGLAMIGRQDLPRAARTAGQSVGRIVGLLQGARARADRFTAHNELKQLQNELRGGLRELDAVKSELALSMSPGGMMGRNLGAMVPSANKAPTAAAGGGNNRLLAGGSSSLTTGAYAPSASFSRAPITSPISIAFPDNPTTATSTSERFLAPIKQTVGAVAEEEWAAQGIAFRSRAEKGSGLRDGAVQQSTSGSAILANLLQQTLIFDQYDRVVQEQDNILQSKLDRIQEKVQGKKKELHLENTTRNTAKKKD